LEINLIISLASSLILSLNEGLDNITTVLNIGASNKKTVAALDKRAEDAIRLDALDNITAKLDIKHIDLVMMDIEAHEIYFFLFY
jgi:hypothetical protein